MRLGKELATGLATADDRDVPEPRDVTAPAPAGAPEPPAGEPDRVVAVKAAAITR